MRVTDIDFTPVTTMSPLKGDKIKSVTIVDLSWVIHKSREGYDSLLCDVGGVPVQVGDIYGTITSILGLVKRRLDGLVFLALDGSTNKRKAYASGYKGQRDDERGKDVYLKLGEILESASLLPNVYCAYNDEYEADDVVASLVAAFKPMGIPIYLYATDNDLWQLLDENVWAFSKLQSSIKYVKSDDVFKKYRVLPDRLVFLRSLLGDKSDNLQGYQGITKKVAQELASSFSSPSDLLDLDGAELATACEGKTKKFKEWAVTLREKSETLLVNYRVMRLCKIKPCICKASPTRDHLYKYKLFSLIRAIEELSVEHGFNL